MCDNTVFLKTVVNFDSTYCLVLHVMAPSDDQSPAISVSSKLIIQNMSTTQGKKMPAMKQETWVKMFDFIFAATRDNYVGSPSVN